MKKRLGVTMTSLVISVAILLIIITFAVHTGFENIQKAKVETYRNDARIVGQVIEVLRLKIETFPEAQKNSYLNRLTLNTGINEGELNTYLRTNSENYKKYHDKLKAEKNTDPKFISMNAVKNIYEEITKLEFKLSTKENMSDMCVEYYTGDTILLPNKGIIYMGKNIRILNEI